MFCEVVLCRQAGRRLRRDEWPAPVAGRLVIRESAAETSSFRRNMRVAQLKMVKDAFSTALVDAVPPIFDPQLLPAPDGQLLIRGIELEPVQGPGDGWAVYEHEQLWLLTPR